MIDKIITITGKEGGIWLVECPCEFFAYRGSKRITKTEAMFQARLEAKRHNRVQHRNKYKISTEGSELF